MGSRVGKRLKTAHHRARRMHRRNREKHVNLYARKGDEKGKERDSMIFKKRRVRSRADRPLP